MASRRDAQGEQYSVLLLDEGAPVVLVDLAWQHHVGRVWLFDEVGRRVSCCEWRRLDGGVCLVERVEWTYRDVQQREFDQLAARVTRRYRLDGRIIETREPGGGGSRRTVKASADCLVTLSRPRFGDLAQLVVASYGEPFISVPIEPSAVPETTAVRHDARPPWRPPRPLDAGDVALLLRTGSRVNLVTGRAATVDVRDIGWLQLPTGSVAAVDLTALGRDATAFTTAVSAGSYPVAAALGSQERGGTPIVLAVELTVRRERVVSWEMALCPGQEVRVLADGEYYGVNVDSGVVCLVDPAVAGYATGVASAGRLFERVMDESAAVVEIPDSGGNLVAFTGGLGDGYYPTWIGRTAHGEVASYVLDTLAALVPGRDSDRLL